MLLVPVDQAGPARRMALAGAAIEIVAAESIVLRRGLVAEPYRIGLPGRLMRIARNCTAVASAATVVAGRRSRALSAVAGATYVAASVIVRFGVFEAGLASARDPKYTVVPQRERLARQGGSVRRSG
jgi:hypothetical protein